MFTAIRNAEPEARIRAWVHRWNFAYPVGLFLFVRAWTLAFASLSVVWLPRRSVNLRLYYGMPPLDGQPLGWLWSPWQRWDTIWYTAIAARGYSSTDLSTAFFPLYPALIRALTTILPINGVAAGLLIASAAGLGAFILFYRLVAAEFDRDAARRALAYLAAFPTAFFLFAAYTESLFLFLALAAWWCAREKRWEWAGVFGGLAALTRPQGALLVLPLSMIFWTQWRAGKVRWFRVVNLVLPVAALGLFLLYLFQITGSPAAWLAIESQWRQAALPWEPLIASAQVILSSGDGALILWNSIDLGLALLFFATLLMLWRGRRWAEAMYVAIILLPPLFTLARFDPYLPLASLPRFLVVAFPGLAVLGTRTIRAPLLQLSVTLALLLQTFMLVVFTQWIFAG
jgi:hypothetical protein